MIEAVEVGFPQGTVTTITGLENATVRIFPQALLGQFGRVTKFRQFGNYIVKTSRGSRGSVRYSFFNEYPEALDYALGYARRVK